MEKTAGGNGFLLSSKDLKNFDSQLFQCDEFKNVVRINYLELPAYPVDEETGEPISSHREFLGGKLISKKVEAYQLNPGQEIKFNKIVDLYSITINKRFLLKEEINKPGVWVYPTQYNDAFEATNQIKVIWDPIQLEQALELMGKSETPKQRLLRMIESALNSMEPNVPCEYVLTIRCSERSVANPEEFLETTDSPTLTSFLTEAHAVVDEQPPAAHSGQGTI